MKPSKLLLILLSSALSISASASAANIKLTFDKALPEAATIIAIPKTGKQTVTTLSKGAKKATVSTTNAQLFFRRADGSVAAIASPKCASTGLKCNSKTVHAFLKKGTFNLAGVKKLATSSVLLASATKASDYKKSVDTSISYNKAALSKSISANGQKILGASSKALIGSKGTSGDSDGDGLPDPLDADNDGDGVLDNYDTNSSDKIGTTSTSVFTLFSNFKTNIDSSINLQTTGLSTAQIDTLMQSVQTLAIMVKGDPSDTAELDCGTLGYCSSGGTGTTMFPSTAFPGTAGGANDSDSDGFGTITRGGTGDFQLQTGATSSAIAAGDTLLQYVTAASSGTTTSYTGTLNFVFVSNPAIKSVAVNSGATQTMNYATTPVLGSSNNCISTSDADPILLTVTGWRPQRPGNTTAGEGAYVDIGNSSIAIDIPNAPCAVGSPGCSGQGPGHCIASAYSTSDTNLSVDGNGIKDNKGDVDSDAANTYTFTINLTSCLAGNTHGAPITWNSNEQLYVDLQFQSGYGDNAAQKICIKKS